MINQKKYSKLKGFTLIEILIVIALVGVIITLVVAALDPSEKINQAQDAIKATHISTIGSALHLYSGFYNLNNYPNPSSVENDLVTSRQLKSFPQNPSNNTYTCTSSTGNGAQLVNGYCYNSASSGDPQNTAVVYVPLASKKYASYCNTGSVSWYAYSGLVNQSGVVCTASITQEPPLIITAFETPNPGSTFAPTSIPTSAPTPTPDPSISPSPGPTTSPTSQPPTSTPTPTPSGCINLNFVSGNVSPSTVSAGGPFTFSCNFGASTNGLTYSSPGGLCIWSGWSGTTGIWNCTAGSTPGTYINRCRIIAPNDDNYCAKLNTINSLTVQ